VRVDVNVTVISKMLADFYHAARFGAASITKSWPRRPDHATGSVERNGLRAELAFEPSLHLAMRPLMIRMAWVHVRAGVHDCADRGFVQTLHGSIERALRSWPELSWADGDRLPFLPVLNSPYRVDHASLFFGRKLIHAFRR
jgi:hypothetical protein